MKRILVFFLAIICLTAHAGDDGLRHATDVMCLLPDATALGVTNALEAAYDGQWPIITGQDCDVSNTNNMIDGKQSMSVFKDTRTLAAQVVEMVNAYLLGDEVPVNAPDTYNNNVKDVPSFLCEPVFADINNYEELLIESGYYTPEDLQ